MAASKSVSSSASPAEAKAAQAAESVAPVHPAIDAGALLSDEEIQTIVGAPLKDRKLSERTDRGLAVSQCYFELPTASDSMVLSVWEGAGPNDTRAKSVWKEMFDRDFDKEEEGEKDEKGEKENKRPEKLAGLGEEAYALPQRFGALIYVLKGGNFFRLSIGGGPSDTKEKKLETLRAASEAVLKRLP
ncbi:MAG: hypothetical protein ABR526_12900 [Chthoniobacterales bacterium]